MSRAWLGWTSTDQTRGQEGLGAALTFGTQKRDSFTANTLCQYFHWLYKRAGLEGASSHSGRRTFITNLASKGVGVRVLAALAGHRNPATTMVYIDASDDMKRKAVELVF